MRNYKAVLLALLLAAAPALADEFDHGVFRSVESANGYTVDGTSVVDKDGNLAGDQIRQVAKSIDFDLDNGSGTTIDTVVIRPSSAITISAARIVYTDATTGTVAAGNVKCGTAVDGAQVFAATAYENTKAVGTVTAVTLASGAVAAATPVICRHTGVAATQAGKAYVELEYKVD